MKRLVAVLGLLTLSLACVAILAAPGALAQVVVGQTASLALPPVPCEPEQPTDEIQLTASSGPSYRVSTAGILTSWSTFAHGGPNQALTLKVFRKTAPFTYFVVGQDTRRLVPNVLNTFPVSIPVQPLDLLGLNVPGGGLESPCLFETGLDDLIMYAEGSNVQPGGAVTFPGLAESGVRLNVSATLLPPPSVSALNPVKGSVTGGEGRNRRDRLRQRHRRQLWVQPSHGLHGRLRNSDHRPRTTQQDARRRPGYGDDCCRRRDQHHALRLRGLQGSEPGWEEAEAQQEGVEEGQLQDRKGD